MVQSCENFSPLPYFMLIFSPYNFTVVEMSGQKQARGKELPPD